jgi:hypothetical protein
MIVSALFRQYDSYFRTMIALFRQYGSHFGLLLFLDNMAAILERRLFLLFIDNMAAILESHNV